MLKKIKHMKSSDCLLLSTFANVDPDDITKTLNRKKVKYPDLLADAAMNPDSVSIEVESVIDQLIFDNYGIYLKVKERFDEIMKNKYDYKALGKEVAKKMEQSRQEIIRYINLVETILLETKFEYPDIRSIQKYFLQDRLNQEIEKENYEFCAELQKRINEC